MTSSNPSHLLINRNPPIPAHPQLFPQSTSRHSHSHARHYSTPGPGSAALAGEDGTYARVSLDARVLEEVDEHDGTTEHNDEEDEEEELVAVHPTFARHAAFKGRIKVMVGRNEFWCHKEILWFASPFFQGLLQGSWAENTRPLSPAFPPSSHRSSSPTDTDVDALAMTAGPDQQAPTATDTLVPGKEEDDSADMSSRKGSVYLDAISEGGDDISARGVGEMMRELREIPDPEPDLTEGNEQEQDHVGRLGLVRDPAMQQTSVVDMDVRTEMLPHAAAAVALNPATPPARRMIRHSFSSISGPAPYSSMGPVRDHRLAEHGPGPEAEAEAVVELHEESAAAFQDFLFWAYPHLDCRVSWTNVAPLVALSSKLLVPALSGICYHFLLTHASGKPIVALALAEEYEHAELYREASRFVLDLPAWNKDEMEDLSERTRLKLSQRRTWFLERLLKLGSIDVRKEYQCRPDCPHPPRCQALVDEKWRQAHNCVCRSGPALPSVAFRCLRQLETFPSNPSLVMPHPLCQAHANSWIKSLFDRMFEFRLINSPLNPGTEKYWLAISL